MFTFLKYALLIFIFFYLIKNIGDYNYADLTLAEISLAKSFFGTQSLIYIHKITDIFSFYLTKLPFEDQDLIDMCYLAYLRLSLPILLFFKSYALFSLFAIFALFFHHKNLYLRQVNLHFQKTLNKYMLFIFFYLLMFLLFTKYTESLIYISYLLPTLILLLIKALFLYLGFPPYL